MSLLENALAMSLPDNAPTTLAQRLSADGPDVLAFSLRSIGYEIRQTVWLVIVVFVACVLLMCLARPAADFTTTRPKKFWLVALGASLLVFVWPYVMPLYLPLHGILQWVALILSIYYVGPERRRMGKGGGWRRRGGRGDSGW